MRRRTFIGLVGGAAAWPHVARAQQSGKLSRIGVLGTGGAAAWRTWISAFVNRLRELDWIEGRTIALDYRWADGRTELYGQFLSEFARLNVDVILTGEASLPAAKQVTSLIPIVLAVSSDPLGSGLIASLARPGGNVTGMSAQSPDLAGKRLQLLQDIFPHFRSLAIMVNAVYPSAARHVEEVRSAGAALGLAVSVHPLTEAEDIAPTLGRLKGRVEALYVPADPLVNTNRVRIGALAIEAQLPTIFGFREYVEAGGLMSYGPNIPDLFRRAGDIVDKILRGGKPAEIPVEQPTKFDFVINLRTAKSLGLDISPTLLARADEVIE